MPFPVRDVTRPLAYLSSTYPPPLKVGYKPIAVCLIIASFSKLPRGPQSPVTSDKHLWAYALLLLKSEE